MCHYDSDLGYRDRVTLAIERTVHWLTDRLNARVSVQHERGRGCCPLSILWTSIYSISMRSQQHHPVLLEPRRPQRQILFSKTRGPDIAGPSLMRIMPVLQNGRPSTHHCFCFKKDSVEEEEPTKGRVKRVLGCKEAQTLVELPELSKSPSNVFHLGKIPKSPTFEMSIARRVAE
ncbi:hypothetical protein BDF20DRAFT_833085 [Mycotypha africana]|uniref:uncharacterized protein n=1 Tax=Mycotypha africana TaxID=64632 RepID=UPI0023015FC1|nr:uncharacterized protein BDF20DRAFT_833085 [Mycotypha africana]KAI8988212.1 hypothetical protein BDF20DRAFT_833085 [Mycotypha africana]